MIGTMELGPALRAQRHAPAGNEAELTFMLARPALTRWQFETERLRQLANNWSAAKRRLALLESELGLAQVKALSDRIEPLTKSQDIAVRFEAQETLVALDSVGGQLGSIRERVRESGPPSAAGQAATAAAQGTAAAEEAETRVVPAPSEKGGDAAPQRAARFEARYIEHLIGRAAAPLPQATAMPSRRDDGADVGTGVDAGSEAAVRDTAYFLWEQDGCPEGRAEQYWQRAVETLRGKRGDEGAGDAFAELAAALGSLCDPPHLPAGAGDSPFQDAAS